MASDTVEMRARCLCRKHVFTASIPRSSLPLPASACHCTSCRHNSGALFMADVTWPNEDEDLSALNKYVFSPNTDIYSCGTCSTQMFCNGQHTGRGPAVFSGALENTLGLVRYDNHIFVGDTIDGGASSWLVNGPDEKPATRWKERSLGGEQLDASWPGDANPSSSADIPASPDVTPLWCHCKGVKLFLKSGKDLAAGTDKKFFKKPEPGTGKYVTHIDACDSCRLALGSDLIHWIFVPFDHLFYSAEDISQGATPPFANMYDLRKAVSTQDPRIGTLALYRSSDRAERYHCSKCSATIFYTEHGLPEQADIAIGVLEHPDGARAESLLAWDRKHSDHIKDTVGGWREGLVHKYVDEARSWRSQ